MEFRRKNRDSSGKSFCQVARVRQRGHERPAITFGNQKWRGAAPSFVIRPRSRNHFGRSGWSAGVVIQIPPNISEKAPRVWLSKYFAAASCSVEVLF